MRLPKLSKKRLLIIAVSIITLALIILVFRSTRPLSINNSSENTATPTSKPKPRIGPLSGLECENGDYRPWAVMLSSDAEARPLAGIGQADMVFEMPVTESGVTRMMAVYQCTHPSEFGSIRSARMDFIPLVIGLDAIYMHWGGEHDALAELDRGVVDNIDCLKLDGSTCKRKSGIPMPHNGYSTSELFLSKARAFGYVLFENNVTYPHEKEDPKGIQSPPNLYSGAHKVTWSYDETSNSYKRTRAGKSEIDRSTGNQVTAKNIVVLNTTSTYISILYNRVNTVGSGNITVYQNGTSIDGTWEKSEDKSKLFFLDESGKEIKLVPGSTWIEIITS